MIFCSPYPDISIPKQPLTQLILRHAAQLAEKPAFIDGTTRRTLTYDELAEKIGKAACWCRGAFCRSPSCVASGVEIARNFMFHQ